MESRQWMRARIPDKPTQIPRLTCDRQNRAANFLFRNILRASAFDSIFCPVEPGSPPANCKAVNTLPRREVKKIAIDIPSQKTRPPPVAGHALFKNLSSIANT